MTDEPVEEEKKVDLSKRKVVEKPVNELEEFKKKVASGEIQFSDIPLSHPYWKNR